MSGHGPPAPADGVPVRRIAGIVAPVALVAFAVASVVGGALQQRVAALPALELGALGGPFVAGLLVDVPKLLVLTPTAWGLARVVRDVAAPVLVVSLVASVYALDAALFAAMGMNDLRWLNAPFTAGRLAAMAATIALALVLTPRRPAR